MKNIVYQSTLTYRINVKKKINFDVMYQTVPNFKEFTHFIQKEEDNQNHKIRHQKLSQDILL